MTPLEAILRRAIELTGPLSLAHYMAECLFHPQHGYYTTRDPFGAAGDFTTSPEISQMFGEILAAWWLAARTAIGLPDMHLCEIGPGRGTLMDDILRTIGKLTGTLPPVHMIETSPRLSAIQKERLAKHKADISWHTGLEEPINAPLGIIANELFDAIPIRQFVKTKNRWLERMVHLNGNGELALTLSQSELDPTGLPPGHQNAPDGALYEYAPARLAFMQMIAQHLKATGGFALIIDYGHTSSAFGDTLQAVRAHSYVSILDQPGMSDLTSHVDFEALAKIAADCGLYAAEIVTQGEFLLGAGIARRAAQLPATANPQAALERLTSNGQMGGLFKVLVVASRPFEAHPLKFDH